MRICAVTVLGVLLAGCSNALPTPTGTLLPTPTPVPQASASVRSCEAGDLRISLTNSMAAAGTVGGYLMFVNVSDADCSLQGAPTLIAMTPSGPAVARVASSAGPPFPVLEGAPFVLLTPGDRAFAAYGGTDNPVGDEVTCPPPYHTFRIAPPGSAASVELPAFNTGLGQDQPSCYGIAVTMVAGATEVEQYADLSTLRP